jgi:hypothetical protein
MAGSAAAVSASVCVAAYVALLVADTDAATLLVAGAVYTMLPPVLLGRVKTPVRVSTSPTHATALVEVTPDAEPV